MNDKLTVGELVYKISGDMDNLKTELKKAEAQIGNLEKAMEKSNTSMRTAQKESGGFLSKINLLRTAVVGFISGALINGIVRLTRAGAELNRLQNSFARLSAGIGLNSNDILSNLQKLSAGTISNKDLILSANRAIVLGVAKDMGEFSTLMQVARIRAADMGITTQQAFDNIVTGIGRSSPLILDNLGIVIKQTEAQEKYAKSLGKTADQLTVNEQREAIKFAVLENGKKQIEEVGEVTLSYADRIAQVTTGYENWKARIGTALLPAMEALVSNLIGTDGTMEDVTQTVNTMGREFYRIAQVLIVVGRSFKQLAGVAKIAVNGIHTSFNIMGAGVLAGAKKLASVLGKDTSLIDGAIEHLAESSVKNGEDIKDAWNDMEANGENFNHAMEQIFNPTDYSPVTVNDMAAAMGGLSDETEGAGDAADEAAKKVEEFQGKVLSLTQAATKAREEVEKSLGEKFKEFSKAISGNVQETVTGLAQIVVGAQDKIKDLKLQLSNTDDSDQQSELRKQIKEQEEILKSRKKFEDRQADTITAIRQKLVDAGIDAEKAGLDNLLNVRSLEEQIEEERRIASLNEFQKFEEEQTKKLILLTDAFITETTMLQQKVETQKQYESDLTTFLAGEDSKRLDNTDAWANATIEKYGQVADSLRNLMSTQAQIRSVTGGVPSTPAVSGVGSSGVSNSTTNTTNISAPVNINGQGVQNFTAKELSAILGFELNKFIR